MIPRARKFWSALAGFIIVILVAGPEAQQAPQFAAGAPPAAVSPREPLERPTDIDLLVGRSTVVNVGSPIARVSLTVPDIADAMVTAPSQLLIHGKQPGTISLFVWDRGGAIKTYEVNVRRDLSALLDQMKQLFPGEPVAVAGNGKDVVLSGTVSSKYVVEKAADVAGGYVEKKENVVNLLKVQEGQASNQVMLRVRFAEVSRSAVQELGASFFQNKANWSSRVAPPGVPSPDFDQEKGLVFSDFLNLFVFNSKEGLGAAVRALQTKGLFQSLAEPNLVAIDGKEASFLAGGEFPIPVVQSGGGNNSVTIMFKEFGVRLSFTPTVLGNDLVRLKVKPEVSSLDFANAVSVDGFRIPALSTRKTETEVELQNGQTFAIAGLLNNTLTSTMSKIPGIGDIPILGKLFQSRAHQKNLTELVVMITPIIIKRGQMGVSEGLPALVAPFLGAPDKTSPMPDPYVASPRFPTGTKNAPKGGAAAPAPAPVTRPIQGAATLPQVPATTTPNEVETPAPATTPAAPALTKAQQKALDEQADQDRKAEAEAARVKAADDKRMADEARVAEKKAADDKRAADKLAKERAIRDAEVAKKNSEVARKKAIEDQKRDKVLSDAAARLKAAQAAYQAEVDKAKGDNHDKAKKGTNSPAPAPRH